MKLMSLIMALLLPMAAMAEHVDNRWTLGLGVGMSVPLNNTDFKDHFESDLAGSIWARYNLTHRWGLQLGYDRAEFNISDDGIIARGDEQESMAMDNFNLMATLNFGHWGGFTPYVGAGLGLGIMNRLYVDSETAGKRWYETTPKVRLGFDWALNNSMGVGFHVDWHYFQTENDEGSAASVAAGTGMNNAQVLVPMLAFNYSFGARNKAPSDSDGDGVNDKNDACPNTPAGTTVDSTGCKVKANDGDGDGVADADDKCPSTPAGKDVNAYGCAAKEVFAVKLDVKFDSGKAVVKDAYSDQIAKVGDFMKEHTGTTTEIEGHTDNTGKKSYNVWLSKKRAEAIRKYLIKNFGIDASRLTAVGYGPDQPISDNGTRAGRAENRRVVASIKTEK